MAMQRPVISPILNAPKSIRFWKFRLSLVRLRLLLFLVAIFSCITWKNLGNHARLVGVLPLLQIPILCGIVGFYLLKASREARRSPGRL